MMYWNDHGMSGWGIGLMTLTVLVFWALLVAGAVALFRHFARTPPPDGPVDPGRPDPEQLLADRLARGEIEPDEYRTRLDALRAGRTPTPR
ncbi:hypothetical protein GCM10010441_21880 [Kitasatospora paracochleata]|uniref:Membrane protein n=1 Tax=Kitasatospora paracochleata TaxID=58354 RepID=A0ABT1J211_9ACTN|nr:SHOCT domain-containing protein [Kitasatospora paracochleata]MCP2311418.1 putative membrane protein [Kitasatospora paracochleata]